MKNKKCIVMLSGGLDSRLAIKIMQEQDFEVLALFFNLPFGTGCCNEKCSFNFSQLQGVKLKVVDCFKGKLFKEYLETLRKATHGRGSGVNPCIDCRIFMFKEAKKIADKEKIDLIVTGEVLGERPMSQNIGAMNIIEEKSGLKGRLLRPLSAKLLPKTNAEEKSLVDRKKLFDIHGRRREKQIALAKKFKIDFPTPGGGCILCEKELKNRLKFIFDRGVDEKEIPLVSVGRHFVIDKCWIVLGRDEKENKIIESIRIGEVIVPDYIGPSAVLLSVSNPPNSKQKVISLMRNRLLNKKVNKLIEAYSKKGSLRERGKFEKFKL